MKIKIPSKDTLILYAALLLMIYQSGTVQSSMNAGALSFKIVQVLLIVLLLWYIYKNPNPKRIHRYSVVVFLSSEILAGISFINYRDTFVTVEYKIFLLFLFLNMIFCVNKENKTRIENALYNVLIVISFVTMIFYIPIEILGINVPYTIFDGGLYEYKNYYGLFYNYHVFFPARISGIFWEPGVNQIYANLALYLYIRLNKRKKIHLVLLLTEIVFTRSMMGYIVSTVLLLVLIMERGWLKGRNWRLALILFGTVSLILVIALFLYKKETTGTGYLDSYTMRSYDLVLGLKIFLERPIFGFGYMNTDVFHNASIYNGGSSNGLLTWMYTTGIAGLLFALFPFFADMRNRNSKERLLQLSWIIIILLFNIGEPIFNLPIMIFIVAHAYSKIIDFREKENEIVSYIKM
jgi:membrane protein